MIVDSVVCYIVHSPRRVAGQTKHTTSHSEQLAFEPPNEEEDGL